MFLKAALELTNNLIILTLLYFIYASKLIIMLSFYFDVLMPSSLVDDPVLETNHKELVENSVIRDGTHAYLSSGNDIVIFFSHLEGKYDTHWYQGTEGIKEYPFNSWLSIKWWPFNEELNLHLMHFQQVIMECLLSIILY